jgi:hypothetical protein
MDQSGSKRYFDVQAQESPAKKVKINIDFNTIRRRPSVQPTTPDQDCLSGLFTGAYTYLELIQAKKQLGERIFREEDSVDDLTPKWNYIKACFASIQSPALPRELQVFLFLVAVKTNENFAAEIKADYLSQPNSDPKFFDEYKELIDYCYLDYLYGDPCDHEKWMVHYNTLHNAWMEKKIPDPKDVPSVCIIAEKKTRVDPKPAKKKKAAAKKGQGRKKKKQTIIL